MDSFEQQVMSPGAPMAAIKLPILDDTNYHDWAFAVELVLDQKMLWTYVGEKLLDNEIQQLEKEPGFARKNREAILILMSSLSIKDYQYLCNGTARMAWDDIKNVYESNAAGYKASLVSKLLGLKLDKPNLTDYDNFDKNFRGLVEQLQKSEARLEDIYASLYLRGLPKELNGMVELLEQQDTDLSLNKIRTTIRVNLTCREQIDRDEELNMTLAVKKSMKFKRTCFHCGKEGHFKRDCPNKDRTDGHVAAVDTTPSTQQAWAVSTANKLNN
ncbi:uncharacterized protein V1518DRAFT_424189, partial [Limtongia smithiae]|uniref:uncharacterized protein n=1 Tax=Limtongia smithiae TaxID=1125753 RepID=UPI0034CDA64D